MPAFLQRGIVPAAVVVTGLFGIGATDAFAVSRAVREACREEYFNYCNMHEVGSPGLRQCMRRNQTRLSDRCVNALVASGEASAGERARAKSARRHHNRSTSRD